MTTETEPKNGLVGHIRQAFTINLDLPTYRRLKIQALDERRSMTAIVRDSLRTYLDVFGPKNP